MPATKRKKRTQKGFGPVEQYCFEMVEQWQEVNYRDLIGSSNYHQQSLSRAMLSLIKKRVVRRRYAIEPQRDPSLAPVRVSYFSLMPKYCQQ